MEEKQPLPNAVAVLVLGICSIVINCYGLGLILGIIGLALASQGRRLYKENPNEYIGWGNLNAGYIMSIIGVCIGALWALFWIFAGAAIMSGDMWGHHHSSVWNQ
jgi:hypothetical protein